MENYRLNKWQLLEKKFSRIADKLGKGIDKGIMETVVVLNVLKINTSQSCEGHLNWGTGGPWVDIEANSNTKLADALSKAWEKADKAVKDGLPRDQVDKLFEEYHKLRVKLKAKNLAIVKRLWPYLEKFYENRKVDYGARLTLAVYGNGTTRLTPMGAEFQEILPLKERKSNLVKYQKEMNEFTEYLKNEYFG